MSTKKHFTNATGGWCRACDHRDYFAEPVLGPRGARTRGLAMTPQMAVIARSGATKQFRCEARWRESSVWFRPLGHLHGDARRRGVGAGRSQHCCGSRRSSRRRNGPSPALLRTLCFKENLCHHAFLKSPSRSPDCMASAAPPWRKMGKRPLPWNMPFLPRQHRSRYNQNL
jgi:hypothetical protein